MSVGPDTGLPQSAADGESAFPIIRWPNVHNHLACDKQVAAEFSVPAALFHAVGETAPDAEGNLRLTAQETVPAGGTHRFDWRLRVAAEGLATVTVQALTDEESDALRTTIPILTRAIPGTTSRQAAFRDGQSGPRTLEFEIPEDARPGETRLTVTLAPTPASAAFEAIPYLAGYPYGCVEQTMSRFYPTVLAARAVRALDIDLAALVERSRSGRSGVFAGAPAAKFLDEAELTRMTEAGLQRLQRFQREDGGWGWWEQDASSPDMTAYVLIGLHAAAEAGAAVDQRGCRRALEFLAKPEERPARDVQEFDPAGARHTRMLVEYALSLAWPDEHGDREVPEFEDDPDERRRGRDALAHRLDDALDRRRSMPLYDRLLLTVTLHQRGRTEDAATCLREVVQLIERDAERGAAHLPVAALDHWHAWNSQVETNAWFLRALVVLERDHPLIPEVVQWLALNRSQGRHWRSTRDTALAVAAIADSLATTGASAGETTVDLRLDDGPVKSVRLARGDILGTEVTLELADGQSSGAGRHVLTVERSGTAPLHVGLHAEFLASPAAGPQRQGLSIARRYYRLAAPGDGALAAAGRAATPVASPSKREPLADGSVLSVGDIVEVELTIDAEEDYEYVAFEDPKPAGCEAVQIRSGSTWGNDLWANVELRDERVVFFAGWLPRGSHVLRYKLRAETPGSFHALPARGFAMYAPEIHARSEGIRLDVMEASVTRLSEP